MSPLARLVFIGALATVLISCRSKTVPSEKELVAYVNDEGNGLKKKIKAGDTDVTVTYRPTDLLVAQELRSSERADTIKVNNLRKKYRGYYYFVLGLSKNDKEALHQTDGFGQYSELVQTLSFRMGDYVTLTTAASDTIPVGDFILDRTYGLSSSTNILFAFNRQKAIGKEWVQFNLNELGMGLGNLRLRFRSRDIVNVPSINFSK
ncbi:MAG: hypothetical protein O9311_18935 [Cytophagales bacterium]|nr:hypothetical protein [Cytophagales bacterium]